MNTPRRHFPLLALLAFSGGAFAQPPQTAPVPSDRTHEHSVFESIVTTYTYADKVVATWNVNPKPGVPAGNTGPVVYTVTITGLTRGKSYSLLTLGVQSLNHAVLITSATNAKFGPLRSTPQSDQEVVAGKGLAIKAVGQKIVDSSHPDRVSIDGEDVWFVTATGEDSVITVESLGRSEIGTTAWTNGRNTGYGSSHDTIPSRSTSSN